jgi:transcriptional regulator with XRE-family HTH domain
MGSDKWTDRRFGKRVKNERDHRGWSQAEMAKMLSDNGIQPMHPTTIAKIEMGMRSVRINEAVGIANLFATSLDELLDRRRYAYTDDLSLALAGLRHETQQSAELLSEIHGGLIFHLANIPDTDIDGIGALLRDVGSAVDHVALARGLLEGASRSSAQILEAHSDARAGAGEAQS